MKPDSVPVKKTAILLFASLSLTSNRWIICYTSPLVARWSVPTLLASRSGWLARETATGGH